MCVQKVSQNTATNVRMILIDAQLATTSGHPMDKTYVKTGPRTLNLAMSVERIVKSVLTMRNVSQGAVLTLESTMPRFAVSSAMMNSRTLSLMNHLDMQSISQENVGQELGLRQLLSYSGYSSAVSPVCRSVG